MLAGAASGGVLKNFAIFTGKHLRQSLFFNKFVGLRPATLLKKRLWYRCFPVNFAKFSKTYFFTEHLRATASVLNYIQKCFCHFDKSILCKIHKKFKSICKLRQLEKIKCLKKVIRADKGRRTFISEANIRILS